MLGPVNVEIQQTRRSRPFMVHIDKVKPYLGEKPATWVNPAELSVTDQNSSSSDSIIPDMAHLEGSFEPSQTVSPPPPQVTDVITFDKDEEFRRTRPRREERMPSRYLD